MSEKRPTVLVVDDNKITTKLMHRYLNANGFDAIEAGDGLECLEKVKEHNPDFVVMDIMMPRMDGLTAVARLKADEATRGIPVAIVTALNDVETQSKAVDAGADDFLTKPIEEKLIVNKARVMCALAIERKRVRRLVELVNDMRTDSSLDPESVLREEGLLDI